jgi:hypothetical protein
MAATAIASGLSLTSVKHACWGLHVSPDTMGRIVAVIEAAENSENEEMPTVA